MVEVLSWLSLVLRILISLGVIGAALGVIRPKLPRAGYTLAAAAGFDMLWLCCMRGVRIAMDGSTYSDGYLQIQAGLSCFGVLQTTLVAALSIASIVMMANEGKAPKA